MNQFVYSESGFCLNPIIKAFKCSKGYEAQVEFCIQKHNLWNYGVKFYGCEEGWVHGCNQYCKDSDLYKTKSEALNAGIEKLLYQIKQRDKLKRYGRIIKMLENELKPVAKQLTLF